MNKTGTKIAYFLVVIIIITTIFALATSLMNAKVRCEGTTLIYKGGEYNLRAVDEKIISVINLAEAGERVVIECYIKDNDSLYLIFNKNTQEFEHIIKGRNLTWEGDNLTAAVYSNGDGVCRYNGYVIGHVDLDSPYDYIRSLYSENDGGSIVVEIGSACSNLKKYDVFIKETQKKVYYRKSEVQLIGQEV